jgi:cytoskeletal protein CcmA (bactofilin family)
VFATELLELQPKGRIIGNVHYKKLEMHSGATVAGTLTHQETGEPVFHMAITQPILNKVSEAGGATRVYNE